MSEEDDMTARASSLETLKETHSFPCDYSFKVIGDHSEAFIARVAQVGTTLTADGVDPEVATRESGEGTYVSVTMSVEIREAETILDTYESLRDIEGARLVM